MDFNPKNDFKPKLKENSHSRALKTIPDENSNSFFVL